MIDKLKEQLAKLETEFKACESTLYRIDGAIQVLRQLILEAEKPVETEKPKEE